MIDFEVKCSVKYGITEMNSDFLLLSLQELNSLPFIFLFPQQEGVILDFNVHLFPSFLPGLKYKATSPFCSKLTGFIFVHPGNATFVQRASLARSDMKMTRGHCLQDNHLQ